jgi:hypothetical protein
MAGLWIPLPPETERRLREQAKQKKQTAEEYVVSLVEASLRQPPKMAPGMEKVWAELPRRDPAELDAMAIAQGVPLNVKVEDLYGDFWPEDETCDEFIATIRRWRQEELDEQDRPEP